METNERRVTLVEELNEAKARLSDSSRAYYLLYDNKSDVRRLNVAYAGLDRAAQDVKRLEAEKEKRDQAGNLKQVTRKKKRVWINESTGEIVNLGGW